MFHGQPVASAPPHDAGSAAHCRRPEALPSAPGSSKRIEATFGFIDLAGFTALTETQGDDDAADVATRFAELTRAALGAAIAHQDDRRRGPRGVAGARRRAGTRRTAAPFAAADKTLPALRAGFHHGPAIERDGDIFGAAVNLAARVAAEAYAGEVLASAAVAAAAAERGIPVVELGHVALKNVGVAPVLSSSASWSEPADSAIDPVCQAEVDRRVAAGQLNHEHKTYWFCSLTCAAAFASNPQWHVAGAKKDGR